MAKKQKRYHSTPLTAARKMVIASVQCNKPHAIHFLSEINVTKARQILRKKLEESGTRFSFTAYLLRGLALCLTEFPEMNSFIRGNRWIQLQDITLSVMVERELDGIKTPEPLGIQRAQDKTVTEIHREIREAQYREDDQLGSLAGTQWVRFIPRFLLKTFIRWADRNIKFAQRYGKVALSSIGMHTMHPTWAIPHGTATVFLVVGGIDKRLHDDQEEEHLAVTASFDHEIVDGSPAARFLSRLTAILEEARFLEPELVTTR